MTLLCIELLYCTVNSVNIRASLIGRKFENKYS